MRTVGAKIYAVIFVVIALLVAFIFSLLLGLSNNKGNFDKMLENSLELDLSRQAYANGLQIGQALRNVYINPSDKKALDNLQNAYKDAESVNAKIAKEDQKLQAEFADSYTNFMANVASLLTVARSGALSSDDISSNTKVWRVYKGILAKDIDILEKRDGPLTEAFSKGQGTIKMTANIFAIIIILVSGASLLWLKSYIAKALSETSKGLGEFFDFLNYKTKEASGINIKSSDEFGIVAKMVNDNIANSKKEVELDQAAIKALLANVELVKSGNMNVSKIPPVINPRLNKLITATEEMMTYIRNSVGIDFHKIRAVFDSYTSNDFSVKIENASGVVEKVTNQLGDAISAMLKANLDVAQLLKDKSNYLETNVADLNKATKSQAHSLEESVAAIEEMSSSMNSISSMTNEVIKQSEDIKGIVTAIRDIADQTNLLALNAAIEAASAGEHGRGFAVVADEVRKLAEKTGKSLTEIEANINILTQSINEMSTSINEQTTAVNLINQAVVNVDAQTKEAVKIAENSKVIADEVERITDKIVGDVKKNKF